MSRIGPGPKPSKTKTVKKKSPILSPNPRIPSRQSLISDICEFCLDHLTEKRLPRLDVCFAIPGCPILNGKSNLELIRMRAEADKEKEKARRHGAVEELRLARLIARR